VDRCSDRSKRGLAAAVFLAAGLVVAPGTGAKAASPDQRLEDFIQVNQFGSPYAGAQIPEQWCYYTRTDRGYSWWYVADRAPDNLRAVPVGNGFGIPFVVTPYSGVPTLGALAVGYVVDGGAPSASLEPVSTFASGAPACSIGVRILSNAPYPVVGLAKDLALQTVVDPAAEYRLWLVSGRYHRVRLISMIPVSFQVGSDKVAGRLVLGFTGDW
jgi:hypothetical protein